MEPKRLKEKVSEAVPETEFYSSSPSPTKYRNPPTAMIASVPETELFSDSSCSPLVSVLMHGIIDCKRALTPISMLFPCAQVHVSFKYPTYKRRTLDDDDAQRPSASDVSDAGERRFPAPLSQNNLQLQELELQLRCVREDIAQIKDTVAAMCLESEARWRQVENLMTSLASAFGGFKKN